MEIIDHKEFLRESLTQMSREEIENLLEFYKYHKRNVLNSEATFKKIEFSTRKRLKSIWLPISVSIICMAVYVYFSLFVTAWFFIFVGMFAAVVMAWFYLKSSNEKLLHSVIKNQIVSKHILNCMTENMKIINERINYLDKQSQI